ncbi:hypothetical protein BN938_1580 [Mucinivorans hirudinis]|uniref:Large secreted protein n=1 Tax=Mucinivorans hirudinis TaxID=1433126 RepID=A0A060R8C6_9BACT|nr:hypothetical protein BN938_1580 [Mucinivorans hirudinis]
MKKLFLLSLTCFTLLHCNNKPFITNSTSSDLQFTALARTWDEGIPLGNGFVGALVWQKNDTTLRMSLDRIDLWDLRPSDSIVTNPKTFDWVYDRVINNKYGEVQLKYDVSYEAFAAPSKIPGAALEFNIGALGEVENVRLYLNNALCVVRWKNGATLTTFVDANRPIGWFVFENIPQEIVPVIVPPTYHNASEAGNSVDGQSLGRLGYEQGEVVREANTIKYHQKGWGDFWYDLAVDYKQSGSKLTGAWSVTSSLGGGNAQENASQAMARGVEKDYALHNEWWQKFWAQSSVNVPDSVLQKQYDNEMYKFGSLTRNDGYIIPLQGVWTADNGKLPPWKGDVHHDLNTELSYWPAYTGNHLELGYSFLNTLHQQKEVYRKFTKSFYELEGLNVPGVATLAGEPMGGWIQYSFSPSTASWLSQHFYLHWRYSMDRKFLEEVGYPFVSEVAQFVANYSKLDKSGVRQFPMSSSPEIYDNSAQAWFRTMTNYDLALSKYLFAIAAEMATELGKNEQAQEWQRIGNEFGDYALAEDGSLAFAQGHPYEVSHRHMSNAMAIHPLSTLDVAKGGRDRDIVEATLDVIERVGSDYWTGYSFSWFANMYARAYNGEKAAEHLRTFAQCFCLSNTFHANGDQTKSGKSKFTYRPFTLEGNMAFASGVQDMLLQSHRGYIEIFPAIPSDWADVSFSNLRGQGAFLVTAVQRNGVVDSVEIISEAGGKLRLKTPIASENLKIVGGDNVKILDGFIEMDTRAGEKVTIGK